MAYLSAESLRHFRERGYLLIPGVYEPDTLWRTRALFDGLFAKDIPGYEAYDSSTLRTDIYRHHPSLAHLVFNEKYISIIRELAGDGLVLLPECAVHRARYVNWHTDTTEQELAGITTHRDLHTPILQVATYFQNNNPETGGGLTVLPGTHRQPDPFLELYSKNWSDRLRQKLLKLLGRSVFHQLDRHPDKTIIPSRLGDLVVFDLRLYHRATPPQRQAPGTEKFAIFNTFTRRTTAGLDYFQFMRGRPEPYYRFFREKPPAPALLARAAELGIQLLS